MNQLPQNHIKTRTEDCWDELEEGVTLERQAAIAHLGGEGLGPAVEPGEAYS
jgi:hypothetical protein